MKSKLTVALLLGWALLASSSPAFAAAADLDSVLAGVAKWESGQNTEPLSQLEQLVRESAGKRAQRAEVEAGLVMLLSPTSTFEAMRFACQQLSVIGSDAAVPALAKLLADNETIGLACLAFGNRPSAKADEALRAALASARGPGRLQIISTLGNRRDPKAVEPLTKLARDTDPLVAQTAIQALGKIATTPARKAIVALNGQANPALEKALADATLRCADTLVKAGNRRAAAAIYETLIAPTQTAFVRRGAFAALLRCDRDGGEKRILQTLRGNDAVLRPVAVAAVRHLPSKSASEKLGRELPGLAAEEQVWLIDSLAARKDAAARTAIATALAASADANVRQAAAQALGRIGDARAARPLAQALAAAKDESEANTLIAALGALPGGRETDQAVLAELNASQGSVRAQLIASLSSRRSSEVLATLLSETDHPNPGVGRAAYRVLARSVTAETLPRLLGKFMAIRDADQRADVETFVEQAVLNVESPTDRSSAVLAALSRAPNLETRQALLRLLPSCGDTEALQSLKAALADSDARVRETAVRALAEWPDDAAWAPLVSIYRNPGNEAQRDIALRGMTRLMNETKVAGSPQADRYRELLAGARSDADLKQILGAMGGAKNAGVLKLALPLLDNSGVRAEAAVAVKKIAEAIKDTEPALAKEALERLGK
jgi:HEAT repeat protein